MRQPIRGNSQTPRNDPCSCGSGKKYKKCHMPRQLTVPPTAEEAEMMDAVSPMIIAPETILEGLKAGKTMGHILQEAQDMLAQSSMLPDDKQSDLV